MHEPQRVRLRQNLWNDGWIVYADTNRNHDHGAGEPILREQDAFANGDHLTGNRLVAHCLECQKDGLPRGLHNGTITYTPVRTARHHTAVWLSRAPAGHVRKGAMIAANRCPSTC